METTLPQKPATIKWAKGLAIFNIILAAAVVALLAWAVEANPADPFWKGFRQAFAEGALGDPTAELTYNILGFIAGAMAFSLVGPILALIAIANPSKGWSYAALIVLAAQIGLSFMAGAMASPLQMAIFILMLTTSGRAYLKMTDSFHP